MLLRFEGQPEVDEEVCSNNVSRKMQLSFLIKKKKKMLLSFSLFLDNCVHLILFCGLPFLISQLKAVFI